MIVTEVYIIMDKFCLHILHAKETCLSGPGCSKLRASLVNVALKCQMLILEICQYFVRKLEKLLHCIAKASLIFQTKNMNIFGYKVMKHLMS